MSGGHIIHQVCADRGIAPGATKGASLHLRGLAAGLGELGHAVTTYAAREPVGPFPVPVQPLASLTPDVAGRADIVYERYSLGNRRGLDLARAAGVPFVLEVNAPLVDEATAHRPETVEPSDRSIETELLAEADLVIAVSTELAAWAAARRTGPVSTIPNGFEPAWFSSPTARPTAHDLVFVGHPKPWHGVDRLPAILAELVRSGRDPSLLLIGGGPGAEEVLSLARRRGVAGRVTVTGSLPPDEAAALVATASIGVAPYPPHEPFYFCPLKIVDYLAAGLPVVSTDQGDVATLVGDAGITVDPSDDLAFAEAVATLLDDPDRRLDLGRIGRARAMSNLTWASVAARTVDAISTAVGSWQREPAASWGRS